MTANNRIDALLALTEKLAACLERETALLGGRQSEALAELQREKSRLAQAYESELKSVRDGRAPLGDAAPAQLRRLSDSARRLQHVVAQNERALRAAKTVNERILKAVVDAIEAQRGKPVGYTGRGAKPPAAPLRRAGSAAAVTLDERF